MQEERQPPQQVATETADNAGMSDGTRETVGARLMRSRCVRLATLGVLVIALSAGVSTLVTKAVQPDYVVFDMKGTIDTFQQQTAQQPVEKGALETLTKRFGAALDASLSDWQAAHGGVILVKGAVVAGVIDITPVIQADIARQMQGVP
ncbi:MULTISPECIES: type-F conjugative transfer system protein TrbI [unclassified Pantoea]|uniref:type-F conjugative transfer system protein TrbI n=1 Tax=unclassified Pantoea TaxID=2630326 RepID=UPI0024773F04|nr:MULTISPECIES: type-F conjugative transfer system protein TrbI [unclassified Pantoea]GME47636.1 type-F conjugative transfer system protein TrbI [Pantoea sp. QMID3]GME47764.1 type-F conjugative transfer system protein TrbI [Pantoea sp. QMID1]GME62610.1 type-F conjugative transfer system protein TrbI [Pantoea sp. QMID4]GME63786.1 type-F conjugative transfer system protein TrbI [Pantoea sp. QMID2]